MGKTIYDEGEWRSVLDRHLELKQMCLKLDIVDEPETARKIRAIVTRDYKANDLCDAEIELGNLLGKVEFVEKKFLRSSLLTG